MRQMATRHEKIVVAHRRIRVFHRRPVDRHMLADRVVPTDPHPRIAARLIEAQSLRMSPEYSPMPDLVALTYDHAVFENDVGTYDTAPPDLHVTADH